MRADTNSFAVSETFFQYRSGNSNLAFVVSAISSVRSLSGAMSFFENTTFDLR